MARCEAITKRGKQCRRSTRKGSRFCPQHVSLGANKCKELTKKDGTRCQCSTLPDSEYCWWHDPEVEEDRRAARAKGGNGRRKLIGIRKRHFVDLLYAGNTITSVCEAMDISVTTYWNTKQCDAEFAAQCHKAMNFRAELVEDALFYSALAGAVGAQKFFLTNRAPKRWKDQRHLDAKHILGMYEMTDDELLAIAQRGRTDDAEPRDRGGVDS